MDSLRWGLAWLVNVDGGVWPLLLAGLGSGASSVHSATQSRLRPFGRKDKGECHCEEGSDEAISFFAANG
jgi:hypothetical protein